MRKNPKPFNTDYLDKEDGHRVFFAEYGNPKGIPVITLHGGPGSKSKPKHVRGYELETYRVITFDQRGCGSSEPAGEIENNTLDHLIADIERIRTLLQIKSWFVAGASWGAALALAYAQSFPTQVRGLLLGSIFLARPKDLSWAFTGNQGVVRLFPDLWAKRLEFLNHYQTDPAQASEALLELLATSSEAETREIVSGIVNWESNLMNAQADLTLVDPEDIDEKTIASVKLFLHYDAENYFLEPDQLLANLDKIADIPAILVHGRYDVLCPVEQAWLVHRRLKQSQLVILPTSNHKLTADGEVAKDIAFNYFLNKYSNEVEQYLPI